MVGAICLSQIRKDKKRILHPVAGWILTLLLVNIAWVFFRAPSLIGAWRILQQPFVNPLGSGIAETDSERLLYGSSDFCCYGDCD